MISKYLFLIICFFALLGCKDKPNACTKYYDVLHGTFRDLEEPKIYLTFTRQGKHIVSTSSYEGEEGTGCTITLSKEDCAIDQLAFACSNEEEWIGIITIKSPDIFLIDEREYRRVE